MSKTRVSYRSNRPLVIKAGQDAAEKIGKRIGAYMMTTARFSLGRKRKDGQPSEPGKPPRASSSFKRSIRFDWDPATRTTVIGPIKFGDAATSDAPEALESGKQTTREVPNARDRRRRRVRANYKARPFMKPAFDQRIGELPSLWKNAIRG